MLIGGIDIGTTGCKLTVYNEKGEFIYNAYREYDVRRTSSVHEIDASQIYEAVCGVISDTVKKHNEFAAIGVTSFGETFVLLDGEDNVLLPSMLYTDPRGGEECAKLCEALGEEYVTHICGVRPHQMYSMPKIMWVKRNLPEIYAKVKRIMLMEDYIVYKLCSVAQIDYSLAARTMALDIRNKCWSSEIFEAAGVDTELMSQLVPTGTLAGEVNEETVKRTGIDKSVKIVSGCHDQVAAAVGAGVFKVGQAVDGTGTVECVTPVFDKVPEHEKLYEEGYSVVPYVFENTYVCYALSFTGGAVLKWYRDNFAKYEAAEAEKTGDNVYAVLDGSIPSEPTGILEMPHFSGAANPYMDNDSRAVIAGLGLENTGMDMYKALMEGVTYEIMVNIEHLSDCDIELDELYATGGGAASPAWLQIKADILGRPVTAMEAKEVGACGMCMMAGTAIGLFKDLYEARDIFVRSGKTYYPDTEKTSVYKKMFSRYKKLYSAMKNVME